MVFRHPVAQTVHDKAADLRMVAVEGIAAAAEVVVVSSGRLCVIDIAVYPLEGEKRAVPVSLCRVVEDHIQDHFDPLILEEPDHLLEFVSFLVVLDGCGIGCIGGIESHCIVSPVFQQKFSVVAPGIDQFVELEDRHQLHGSDAQILEIRDLLYDPCKSAGILDAGRLMSGKSTNVHLINDGILHRRAQKVIRSPVVCFLHHSGVILFFRSGSAPGPLAGHGSGVGIQHQLILVKIHASGRIIRAVQLVGIFKFFHIQSGDKDRIDISHAVGLRDPNDGIRHRLLPSEKEQIA